MAKRGTPDQRSDQELVRLCNTGDPAEAARAFESLYSRHKDYVIRVALRFVQDRDMALDVLQETFGYLLRKLTAALEGSAGSHPSTPLRKRLLNEKRSQAGSACRRGVCPGI